MNETETWGIMLGIPNVGVNVVVHEPMFRIVLQHWEYYIYIYIYICVCEYIPTVYNSATRGYKHFNTCYNL